MTEEGAARGDCVGDSAYAASSVSTGTGGRVTGRGASGEVFASRVCIEKTRRWGVAESRPGLFSEKEAEQFQPSEAKNGNFTSATGRQPEPSSFLHVVALMTSRLFDH